MTVEKDVNIMISILVLFSKKLIFFSNLYVAVMVIVGYDIYLDLGKKMGKYLRR